MYNHFPTIKLEESIQNRPSTAESSTDFIVGCVVISPYYKPNEDSVQLIRSQSRLLELFTDDSNPLSASSDITLLNAYRLVKKCSLLVLHSYGGKISESLLSENFNGNYGSSYTGGNDGRWNGSIAANPNVIYTGKPWSSDKIYGADRCVRLGTTSVVGKAISPEFSLSGDATLAFRAGGWGNQSTTLKVILHKADYSASIDLGTDSLYAGMWKDYSYEISGDGKYVLEFIAGEYGVFFLDEVNVTSKAAPITLKDEVDSLYKDEYNVVNLWSDLGHPTIRDEFKKLVEEDDGWLLSEDKSVELRTPRQAVLSYRSPDTDMKESITLEGQSQVVAQSPFGTDTKTCAFSFELSPSVMYIETLLNNISEGHDYAGVYSYNYGRVTNIDGLSIQYRRCDREKLFELGYNCIYLNKNKGQYFFASNRTTGTQGNTTDKESTRRLANDINHDLFMLGENYIGRNASTLLLEEITSDVKILMSKYESAKEPIAGCKITCDLTNNTENDLANGRINLEVAVQVSQQTDNILIFTRYIVTDEE